MGRVVVSLVALVCLTAFAPAPLPRPSRGNAASSTEITLRTFEGTWRVVSFVYTRVDGNHVAHAPGFTHVKIKGSEWAFVVPRQEEVKYLISIDGKKNPVALDFWTGGGLREEEPLGRGIIRRKGDAVEVVYSFNSEQRATGFDPPPAGQWLLKLQRQR